MMPPPPGMTSGPMTALFDQTVHPTKDLQDMTQHPLPILCLRDVGLEHLHRQCPASLRSSSTRAGCSVGG